MSQKRSVIRVCIAVPFRPAMKPNREGTFRLASKGGRKPLAREGKTRANIRESEHDGWIAERLSLRHQESAEAPGILSDCDTHLALGIGANTAIFTLLNAVIFKPLPVSAPQIVFFDDTPSEGTSQAILYRPVARLRKLSILPRPRSELPGLSAFRSGEARLSVRGVGSQTGEVSQRGHLVSGNYFSVLGVNAMLGRALTAEDDKPGAPPAAVMSHGCWTQQWKSDPSIINKEIVINGTSFTLVGVMPSSFFGVRVRRSPDFWLPLAFQPQIELRPSAFEDRRIYWLNFVGRLKPGVSLEQAQASANSSFVNS